jgi:hypothetical protein
MVASAVFITDLQGKNIISRNYRGDVPMQKALERFQTYLLETTDESKKPVFHVDSNGDCLTEDNVGATGVGGEAYIYIAVCTMPLDVRSKQVSGRPTVCDELSSCVFPTLLLTTLFSF